MLSWRHRRHRQPHMRVCVLAMVNAMFVFYGTLPPKFSVQFDGARLRTNSQVHLAVPFPDPALQFPAMAYAGLLLAMDLREAWQTACLYATSLVPPSQEEGGGTQRRGRGKCKRPLPRSIDEQELPHPRLPRPVRRGGRLRLVPCAVRVRGARARHLRRVPRSARPGRPADVLHPRGIEGYGERSARRVGGQAGGAPFFTSLKNAFLPCAAPVNFSTSFR